MGVTIGGRQTRMNSDRAVLLGELAVALKLITPRQRDEALRIQEQSARAGKQERVGEILVRQGALTKEQLGFLVSCQPSASYQCPVCKRTLKPRSDGGPDALACPRCGEAGTVVLPAEAGAALFLVAAEQPEAPDGEEASAGATGAVREIGGVRYQILHPMASGSAGTAHLATDPQMGRTVLIKCLPTRAAPDARARELLEEEVRNAAALVHPNIVTIYAVDFAPHECAVVMEHVERRPVNRLADDGLLAPRRIAQIVSDIARALHYAHDHRVVHRDLQASSILIGGRGCPKVAGLGLTGNPLFAPSGVGESQALPPTPYAAPEQLVPPGAALPASNIFSLGVILYELLTGHLPHPGTSPEALRGSIRHHIPQRPQVANPKVHVDLETICLRCLEKRPSDRFPSAGALADEVDCYLRGEPLTIRPAALPQRCLRRLRAVFT